jgi:hypothetical protein
MTRKPRQLRHKTFSNELLSFIRSSYLETYSTSEVIVKVNEKFKTDPPIGRTPIANYLNEIGIYEGVSGENQNKFKKKKYLKTMTDRYGVINPGQFLEKHGYTKYNHVPYKKITMITEGFKAYKKAVAILTRKNASKITPPDYCEYTGIKFNDCYGITNPNDPCKRSIDHKIAILTCYLNDVSVEKCAHIDNLAFVLRYVNTVKSNTDYDGFLHVAIKLRKLFKDAGNESN